MAREKAFSFDDVASQLQASNKTLHSFVQTATTLAAQLADLHAENTKLGAWIQKYSPHVPTSFVRSTSPQSPRSLARSTSPQSPKFGRSTSQHSPTNFARSTSETSGLALDEEGRLFELQSEDGCKPDVGNSQDSWSANGLSSLESSVASVERKTSKSTQSFGEVNVNPSLTAKSLQAQESSQTGVGSQIREFAQRFRLQRQQSQTSALSQRSGEHFCLSTQGLRPSVCSSESDGRGSTNGILAMRKSKSMDLATALAAGGMRLARTSRWVVNPERSRALEKWDVVTMCSLVFVAIVTPVQISMTGCVLDCPLLFAINTVVDLIFFLDLVLQFFLMYPKKTERGHVLEHRHKQIVRNYLKTWFAIDFLSIFPFDLISALSNSSALTKMKAIKVVRLMRLLKLVRVLKASRLFRRFEIRTSITYQRLALMKFFAVLAALMHWMACLWALTLMLVDDTGVPRWVDAFDEQESNVVPKTRDSIFKLYVACLYFTSYTITSVGYGDIGPQNFLERVVCTLMVLVSGISWAMVLGQVCGVVGSMDVEEQQFRKTMDELNIMMEDRQLPTRMRRRLRAFFISNKLAQRHKRQGQIIDAMSPGLQGEVVLEMNRMWLEKVRFLRDVIEHAKTSEAHVQAFVYEVARSMKQLMFAQGERFGKYQVLYILNRGIVSWRKQVLRSGDVCGTDFLLSDITLHRSPVSFCMTYVSLTTLTREDLMTISQQYPAVQLRVRRYVCWLAMQRGIMLEAKRRIKARQKKRKNALK